MEEDSHKPNNDNMQEDSNNLPSPQPNNSWQPAMDIDSENPNEATKPSSQAHTDKPAPPHTTNTDKTQQTAETTNSPTPDANSFQKDYEDFLKNYNNKEHKQPTNTNIHPADKTQAPPKTTDNLEQSNT